MIKKCPACSARLPSDAIRRLTRFGIDQIPCPDCKRQLRLHPLHSLLLTAVSLICFLKLLDIVQGVVLTTLLTVLFAATVIFHKHVELLFPLLAIDEHAGT